MEHQQHGMGVFSPKPAQQGEAPSQNELLRKVHEMEREIENLRNQNEFLAPPPLAHIHSLHHHDVIVSPLILSPSSQPPSSAIACDSPIIQKNLISPREEELLEQLRIKDQKIESLEQNILLYQKRLKQTEELMYELQWDPLQDHLVSRLEDRSTIDSKYEKKISQLLDQMRIMEKGLKSQQQQIDSLSGRNNKHFQLVESAEIPRSAQDVDHYLGSSLRGLVIAEEPQIPPHNSNYHGTNSYSMNHTSQTMNTQHPLTSITRGDQTLRRRNSSSLASASSPTSSSSSSSWLDYIPFWSADKQQPNLN